MKIKTIELHIDPKAIKKIEADLKEFEEKTQADIKQIKDRLDIISEGK